MICLVAGEGLIKGQTEKVVVKQETYFTYTASF